MTWRRSRSIESPMRVPWEGTGVRCAFWLQLPCIPKTALMSPSHAHRSFRVFPQLLPSPRALPSLCATAIRTARPLALTLAPCEPDRTLASASHFAHATVTAHDFAPRSISRPSHPCKHNYAMPLGVCTSKDSLRPQQDKVSALARPADISGRIPRVCLTFCTWVALAPATCARATWSLRSLVVFTPLQYLRHGS